MARRFGSDMGWAILDAVADGVEILQYATYRPTALLRYGLTDLKTMDILRERQRMKQSIRRLERSGRIERIRTERGVGFRLTEFGERMVRERQTPRAFPQGLYTIVSFDIPERQKRVRAQFRAFLRRCGFVKRHRSVWISDRDWSSVMREEAMRRDVSEWVVIIIGEVLSTSS